MRIYLVTNRVSDGFTPGAEAFAAWAAWFDGLVMLSPIAAIRPATWPLTNFGTFYRQIPR